MTLDRFSGANALAAGDRKAGSALLIGGANVAKSAYGFWGGTRPTRPTDRGGSSYPGSKY